MMSAPLKDLKAASMTVLNGPSRAESSDSIWVTLGHTVFAPVTQPLACQDAV